ncbi:DUF3800 domain-containing protein [Tepidibacillus sp. LV47]|uniref:DUF3800 domain-containing protein n=1 Tax=Tepidibacillus sp. LV47 TaxID=3398228 RepID=UPI003AB0C40A
MDWKKRPTILNYWPDNIDFIMGMDENGTADLKSIRKIIDKNQTVPQPSKIFTLTGVVTNLEEYERLKNLMNDIKFTYWKEGLYPYKDAEKRVVFHSKEIRKKESPFDKIDYKSFITDLSRMIERAPGKIISASINKEEHYKKYVNPYHPYHLTVDFILERYCHRLNELNKDGIILLEARGKKEDKFVLKHIVEVIENGTIKKPASHFRHLKGAYFNPKWSDIDNGKKSFVILEYADLVSYPIYKYFVYNTKDLAFEVVERKLFKYPNYIGWGLKKFLI